IVTNHGVIIRLVMEEVSVLGRNTQGVRLIKLSGDQKVATVAKVKEEIEEEALTLDNEEAAEEAAEDITEETLTAEESLNPSEEETEERTIVPQLSAAGLFVYCQLSV